jgi:hypothetical protein
MGRLSYCWRLLATAVVALSSACTPTVPPPPAEVSDVPPPAPATTAGKPEPADQVTAGAASGPIVLRDVTREVGLAFQHTDGGSGKRYIIEGVSAGLALFDFDGDGDEDIHFLNGSPLRGTNVTRPPCDALYRNEGAWKFVDISVLAGVADLGYGLGITIGDYDNDGFPDLYLNNYGPNVLYHNNGDGTFSDVAAAAGVTDGEKVGAGACFLDADADGDLDLFSGNYVNFSYATYVPFTTAGYPSYPGPNRFGGLFNTLFQNNADGTFSNISVESGVGAHEGTAMGMVAGDFDADGDTDIFVCNDGRPNFLFRNDGTGKFTEVATTSGVAYNMNGDIMGGMGVDCGDYDNDGRLDLYMTNYQREVPVLFRNLGADFFEDVSLATGAGEGAMPYVTWGNGLIDFDNDGDRDIYIACGHVQDLVELYDDTTRYRSPNILLQNTGSGSFANVSRTSGDGLDPAHASRGVVFGDLDRDGDVDIVVLNSREPATLIRNDSPNRHHWIQLQLRGASSNRDGVGAQVRVVAGDLTQVAEVHSGRSYQSHYGSCLHFGLGGHHHIDRIEIHWIPGKVETFSNLDADQRLIITEGGGVKRF